MLALSLPDALHIGLSSPAQAMVASVVACLMSIASIMLISRLEHWAVKQLAFFISFSAGVLISVSFLHLLPEAIEMTQQAAAGMLAGFLLLHGLNRIMRSFVCHDHGHHASTEEHCVVQAPELHSKPLLWLALTGIGFHALMDGMIYSITYHVSALTGTLAAVGLILHKWPEGMITYLLLAQSNLYSKKQVLLMAIAVAALLTPVGTIIAMICLQNVSLSTLGGLMSMTAGMLFYIGSSHLLPETEGQKMSVHFLSMGLGVLVTLIIIAIEGVH